MGICHVCLPTHAAATLTSGHDALTVIASGQDHQAFTLDFSFCGLSAGDLGCLAEGLGNPINTVLVSPPLFGNGVTERIGFDFGAIPAQGLAALKAALGHPITSISTQFPIINTGPEQTIGIDFCLTSYEQLQCLKSILGNPISCVETLAPLFGNGLTDNKIGFDFKAMSCENIRDLKTALADECQDDGAYAAVRVINEATQIVKRRNIESVAVANGLSEITVVFALPVAMPYFVRAMTETGLCVVTETFAAQTTSGFTLQMPASVGGFVEITVERGVN